MTDPLPDPLDLYLKTPLYSPVNLASLDEVRQTNYLREVEHPGRAMDTYCLGCEAPSIFQVYAPRGTPSRQPPSPSDGLADRFFEVRWRCVRGSGHVLVFYFQLRSLQLTKIGQFPSLADLTVTDLAQYRQILGQEKYKELVRGVGLAAQGFGIGAFAYLRRVFEYLIDRAAGEANQALPSGARMNKKIELLMDHLPAFLVENRQLYAILSKGVHALTEDECLLHFDLIKTSIELILYQSLDRQNRGRQARRASSGLQRLRGRLKDED